MMMFDNVVIMSIPYSLQMRKNWWFSMIISTREFIWRGLCCDFGSISMDLLQAQWFLGGPLFGKVNREWFLCQEHRGICRFSSGIMSAVGRFKYKLDKRDYQIVIIVGSFLMIFFFLLIFEVRVESILF